MAKDREKHNHSTMTNPGFTPGNGLILYFRTENMNRLYANAKKGASVIIENIYLNKNTLRKEFLLNTLTATF